MVDFRAFQALCASKVELVVKVSGVSNECIVLQCLLVVKVMTPFGLRETKMSNSDITVSTWTPS